MKRLVLSAAALVIVATGAVGVGAARADTGVPVVASSTNDLLSKIPGFQGPSTRHVCVIDDPLDFYYCVFIPLP